MIHNTGPDKAPGSSTSSLDTQAPERGTRTSASDLEQLNPQGLNLHMPSVMAIAAPTSEELATPTSTPALVVKKGTREFDTGASIKVEALTVAA